MALQEHNIIILSVFLTLFKPTNGLALKKSLPLITETITEENCSSNRWVVCCDGVPAWKPCPFQDCKFIKDSNGNIANDYNNEVIEKGTNFKPSYPRDLFMKPVFNNNSTAAWNISWKLPEQKRNLKGFLLEVKWENEESQKWVFDVDENSKSELIHHTCSRIFPVGNYLVKVYSLPGMKSMQIYASMEENHVQPVKGLQYFTNCSLKWNGMIRKTESPAPTLCFFAAPSCFNYGAYQLFVQKYNDTGFKMKKSEITIINTTASENNVFCSSFQLSSGSYKAVLVAKKSHDEECGWMGGCNYYLNFTIEHQLKLTTTEYSLQETKPPALTNSINIIISVVCVCLVFFFVILIFCIKKCLDKISFSNYGVMVLDADREDSLEKEIMKLSSELSTKCGLEIRVIISKCFENNRKADCFREIVKALWNPVKRVKGGKNRLYILDKNGRQIEGVLNMILKADVLLLVHTKSSFTKFEQYFETRQESKNDIVTKINCIYGQHLMTKLKEKLYENFSKECKQQGLQTNYLLPPRCHLTLQNEWVKKLQNQEKTFLLMKDAEDLVEWVKSKPVNNDEEEIIPPEKIQKLDASIQELKLSLWNKNYDATLFEDFAINDAFSDSSSYTFTNSSKSNHTKNENV